MIPNTRKTKGDADTEEVGPLQRPSHNLLADFPSGCSERC